MEGCNPDHGIALRSLRFQLPKSETVRAPWLRRLCATMCVVDHPQQFEYGINCKQMSRRSNLTDKSPTLVWFRLDLRLADNPALLAAVDRGCPIIPVFIWSPDEEKPWPPGAASRWWLHQSLASLQ